MATVKGIAPDAVSSKSRGASPGYIPGTYEGGSTIRFSPANEYIGSYFQALYGWSNNSSFYAYSAEEMKPFYRMVQNWEWWCTGIVPNFHNFATGVVPTLLAQTVVRKCADLIYGGGVMFESAGDTGKPGADAESGKKSDALSFVSDTWAKSSGFKTALQDALYMESMLGTSALKLNKGKGSDLWCEAVPMSRMYPVLDARGRLDAVSIYLRPYTETMLGATSGKNNGFVLVEERFYKKIGKLNLPHRCCRVYRSGVMINQFAADSGSSLAWEQLPHKLKEAIKADYGDMRIGEPEQLPLINLGIYLLRFTPSVSKMPWLKLGDSAIERCIEDLCKYDILAAQILTEMYVSRARVLADKSVQSPGAVGYSANTGLDDYIFTWRGSFSTEGGPITPVQPEIRSEQLKGLRNIILENIATSIGLSPSSFAPYLQDNSNRTAREVSAEESATTLFVENKRDLVSEPINELIKTVLRYYGRTEDVVVSFSKAGQTNYTLLVENTARARAAGIMSLQKCVEQANPSMDHAQVLEEIERIRKEESEKQQFEMGAFPEFDFAGVPGGGAS